VSACLFISLSTVGDEHNVLPGLPQKLFVTEHGFVRLLAFLTAFLAPTSNPPPRRKRNSIPFPAPLKPA
jgi:hypothetical protein